MDFFAVLQHDDELLDLARPGLGLLCGLDSPEDGIPVHSVDFLEECLGRRVRVEGGLKVVGTVAALGES